MTAALAAVLCGLGTFTFWGTLQATHVTTDQSHALALDAMFSDARSAVAVEEMHTRQYQLEPSVASRVRYEESADAADEVLRGATETATGQARKDALRLSTEQAEFRLAADRLIELVTDRNPSASELDRLEVAPAYYTLQQDINNMSIAYHSKAEHLVADQRRVQTRILATTALGFTLGLLLVAMIWRLMLSYQRRLVEHADASQHRALHDPLTGLPNRTLLQQRLTAAHAAAQAKPDHRLAVMIIDLNGFKGVNDTLGHQAGDELLIAAGRRLRDVVREGDTVARIGGDEFAVLLPSVADIDSAQEIAERAAGVLRRNFQLDAGPAAVSGSVGIAVGSDGTAADELLRRADAAMYRAKTGGKGVARYDPEVDIGWPDRMALFGDLRAVLDTGDPASQLVLYYQPQVRIADGTVTAAEALVRWRHPELGLLLPGAFLSIAESGRLEVPLTFHVMRLAVAEAARWVDAGRPLIVAVNVSPNCLLDEDFVSRVQSALAEFDLPPRLLRLELTESSMMTEPDQALAVLHRVQADGVQVSIDDFGTGFSSLNQLKRLTADELKIDRTFIQELATNAGDAVLVRSSIDLAHNLDLFVTAEGVEDPAALAILRDLGCDYAQGFALARPVAAEGLAAACVHAEKQARAALALSFAVQPRANNG
jgi:diguanylate cyclase (GGDEF)-like protein